MEKGDEKKTALEVPVQEQFKDIYPTRLKIINKINNGRTIINDHIIVDSSEAIEIEIQINDSRYDKKQVRESIKIACQKLVQYFD
ncbi:hypothetical protein FDB30_03645 [Clostridium botulinum]|uniref:Uncharacterized protein n=1 Tax=Clostridium botulinum TaxID=1491 RepID=A0A0L9YAU9_CLOBO|nr:hypothetical protein [Clostridium botulinum]KOM88763.1 hypothetical protein ACP51_05875 [Clostridium botulinum]KOR57599.1 hypothetical protein ADT22_12565 [Clostridium botulinum]MBY7025183.1 hypothetical protein [Clostridium botulinum]NFE58159.1 hypothetical protein [Clostridium botulinum]NFE83365.1 hypothetical protein [Clostridium botulinum]